MANLLYGAPELELEENNDLVARLRKEHQVTYLRDYVPCFLNCHNAENHFLYPGNMM